MRKKKNNFLLFCFSLIPGAGEMYLGFMKTGVSLLGLFVSVIAITSYTNIGILAFAVFVVWLYSFFHANNLGNLSDEEFYGMEDTFLFGLEGDGLDSMKDTVKEKYRKVLAVVLIVLGVSMLWQTCCDLLQFIVGDDFYYAYIMRFTRVISSKVPRLVIGMAIIWLGVKLVKGKKEELDTLELLEDKTETRAETAAEAETGKEIRHE